ncbi:MAG: protein-disulfide isomerase-like protein with CxxC motif [Candidatus Azotimanducaceae bacterium]
MISGNRSQQQPGRLSALTLPEDRSFSYHSELACRTSQIARSYLRPEPWEVFEAIQKAFYVNRRNIADLDTLYTLMEPYGMSYEDFATMLIRDDIVSMTRNEFDWCGERGIQARLSSFIREAAQNSSAAGMRPPNT